MSFESNPYASPLTTDLAAPPSAEVTAEMIRRKHLSHEASVRSVGFLYYLGGGFLVLAGMGLVVGSIADPKAGVALAFLGVFYFVMGSASLAIGWGLRGLQPWVRIPVGIFSGIGLLGFPLGTLINGYILYLVFSSKGTMVFSPEYQEIIYQTPHIKYRSSLLALVLLAILIVIIVGGILCALLLV